ncbi:hypothetical protein FACS1894122_02110 [Alphaproteobacteria bacterium]|nr:hypothetical protein FACS1894122_02110 [Alphaproteobacteria bacterium]
MFSGNPKINAVPIAHLATPDVYPVTSDDRSVTPDDFFARLDDFLEESNTQDTLDVCRLTKNILHLVKDKVAKDSSCSTQNSANNVAAQICGCECNCENVSRHKCNCFTFKTVWGHGFCFAKESLGAWLDAWNAKILVLGGIKKSLLHKYISIADIPTLNALLPAASKYKDLILETVFDTTVFTKEVLRESVVNAATTGKYNYISELSERLKRTSDAAFHSSAINDAFVSVAAICESSDLLHSLEALIKTGGVMNNSIYRAIRERSVTGKPFFDFLSRIAYKTGHSGYLVPANVLENLY